MLKRALDCALPAPGDGHTHEEQAARDARGVRANCSDRGFDRSHHLSRYLSDRHLPSGIEEDGKGQTGCGRRHAFTEPFLKSLWSYPKQAGELFQAQVMRFQK